MTSDFDETLLDKYDDSTLADYIKRAPHTTSRGGVRFLSPSLISKPTAMSLHKDALKSMDLARQLGIRVPAVRRILEVKGVVNSTFHTIMERIDGMNLFDCWHQLGWLTTLKLAFQLRYWVRRMRTQVSPTAGGLHSGNSIQFG